MLLIDNQTGKATRVNFAPMTLEAILRSVRRDRPLLLGYLLEQLHTAALKLWPELGPLPERPPLNPSPAIEPREGQEMTPQPWRPPWRRNREAQSLVEYSLVVALIAIVAIVALAFIGSQISGMLTNLGNSI